MLLQINMQTTIFESRNSSRCNDLCGEISVKISVFHEYFTFSWQKSLKLHHINHRISMSFAIQIIPSRRSCTIVRTHLGIINQTPRDRYRPLHRAISDTYTQHKTFTVGAATALIDQFDHGESNGCIFFLKCVPSVNIYQLLEINQKYEVAFD